MCMYMEWAILKHVFKSWMKFSIEDRTPCRLQSRTPMQRITNISIFGVVDTLYMVIRMERKPVIITPWSVNRRLQVPFCGASNAALQPHLTVLWLQWGSSALVFRGLLRNDFWSKPCNVSFVSASRQLGTPTSFGRIAHAFSLFSQCMCSRVPSSCFRRGTVAEWLNPGLVVGLRKNSMSHEIVIRFASCAFVCVYIVQDILLSKSGLTKNPCDHSFSTIAKELAPPSSQALFRWSTIVTLDNDYLSISRRALAGPWIFLQKGCWHLLQMVRITFDVSWSLAFSTFM